MKVNDNSYANPYDVDRSLYSNRKMENKLYGIYMRIIIPFIGETRGRGREDGGEDA
jgi:hypothetical protein